MNTGTLESPRELARQSEAKRKQSPQSEANVCRHKSSLEKTSLINYTGHPIIIQNNQHKLGVAFSYLERKYIH